MFIIDIPKFKKLTQGRTAHKLWKFRTQPPKGYTPPEHLYLEISKIYTSEDHCTIADEIWHMYMYYCMHV